MLHPPTEELTRGIWILANSFTRDLIRWRDATCAGFGNRLVVHMSFWRAKRCRFASWMKSLRFTVAIAARLF